MFVGSAHSQLPVHVHSPHTYQLSFLCSPYSNLGLWVHSPHSHLVVCALSTLLRSPCVSIPLAITCLLECSPHTEVASVLIPNTMKWLCVCISHTQVAVCVRLCVCVFPTDSASCACTFRTFSTACVFVFPHSQQAVCVHVHYPHCQLALYVYLSDSAGCACTFPTRKGL